MISKTLLVLPLILILAVLALASPHLITYAQQTLNTDVNGDGVVNFADFSAVISDFGQAGSPVQNQQPEYQLIPNNHTLHNLYLNTNNNISIRLLQNGNDVTENNTYYYSWIPISNNNIITMNDIFCDDDSCGIYKNITATNLGSAHLRVFARKFPEHDIIAQTDIHVSVYGDALGICNTRSLEATASAAPATFSLPAGGNAAPNSGLIGFQYDFEGDGLWDTGITQTPVTHTYTNPGEFHPRYRLVTSNNRFTSCNHTETITILPGATQEVLPSENPRPVNWRTDYVSLTADDFLLEIDGVNYYITPETSVRIHSNPGNEATKTLEITWHQHGREMHLFMYFLRTGPDANWISTEIRTYNGVTSSPTSSENPGWIYYTANSTNSPFFSKPVGESYTGDVTLYSDPDVWTGHQGIIHFKNLQLEAFTNL